MIGAAPMIEAMPMTATPHKNTTLLRLGFVPLTDCAPLVMAEELGLFRKHGLRVVLSRELGWATIRDKVLHGELDAAHALAAMPFAATLGLGSPAVECLTGLVLNLQGNAITLSRPLWSEGVTSAAALRRWLATQPSDKRLTLGVVHPFSSHHFLLRQWLREGGIDADRHARIVVVPPPQMCANLGSGNLDGFCVGEPWNSVAVRTRVGSVVTTSAQLDPGHPEKVLMVRRRFSEDRDGEHLRLIAALLEACEFCQRPANRRDVARVLSHRRYVNVEAAVLEAGLNGTPDPASHAAPGFGGEFTIFHRDDANEPCARKAGWVISNLRRSGLLPPTQVLAPELGRRVFRADIFDRALEFSASQPNPAETESHDTQLVPA